MSERHTVGVRELKAKLSAWLALVEGGATVIVLDRRRAVAALVPFIEAAELERPVTGMADPEAARSPALALAATGLHEVRRILHGARERWGLHEGHGDDRDTMTEALAWVGRVDTALDDLRGDRVADRSEHTAPASAESLPVLTPEQIAETLEALGAGEAPGVPEGWRTERAKLIGLVAQLRGEMAAMQRRAADLGKSGPDYGKRGSSLGKRGGGGGRRRDSGEDRPAKSTAHAANCTCILHRARS